MKFKSVVMPRRVEHLGGADAAHYGCFVVEPLERGFGTTLGNSLRRVLLSSLQGSAVVGVSIAGVLQEISAIPGVSEDVTDIVLNLKELVVRSNSDEAITLRLSANKEGPVTAAALEVPGDAEVLNPELHIATLDSGASLKMEIKVANGRGYVAAEKHGELGLGPNAIPVDANFSPIRRVKYRVEDTRVGDIIGYDKLTMEIWTNGVVSPEDALSYAAKILKDHLRIFITMEEEELAAPLPQEEPKRDVNPNLWKCVDELELSIRSYNCLKAANIRTIGKLVQKTDQEMLKFRNFGKKSLQEIKELLAKMGLSLGMTITDPELLAFIEREEEKPWPDAEWDNK
ncbi:DNA-directed RNA polymerase subunit alpha [bacterium]|nr:DNA-directed RNA polymerase subunit alpha [bacterium]